MKFIRKIANGQEYKNETKKSTTEEKKIELQEKCVMCASSDQMRRNLQSTIMYNSG